MRDWVWVMGVCFDKMVHGQSSWNNTWPKPRPNTNMCDWVWVMEVCFDKMVHGQSSWNNTCPKPRPNTNMHDWYGWWRYALIWRYMVSHHEKTYGPSQDPIPMMVHGHGHHWSNIWPKPRPNTSMSNLIWMIAIGLKWWYMVITETIYDPSQDPIPIYVYVVWYDNTNLSFNMIKSHDWTRAVL